MDHIGRPVFATNSAGTKTWTASYLPFGEVLTTTGTPIALRFPGQWFQSESGLHQNWMRDYDPTLGRYIEPDPIGLEAGVSLYGYALQNPGRYIDPTGENPLALCATPVGGIICREAAREAAKVCVAGAQIVAGAVVGLFASTDEACGCKDDKCSPSESPVWNSFLPHRGKTKTNGLSGSARRYYQWDYTHCEIEMYDRRGNHLGVIDPRTGGPIKPAVPGRRISLS